MFDDKEQRWMPWTALVPRYVPRVNQKFYEIMVPTVDSVRNTWLLNLAIQVTTLFFYLKVFTNLFFRTTNPYYSWENLEQLRQLLFKIICLLLSKFLIILYVSFN